MATRSPTPSQAPATGAPPSLPAAAEEAWDARFFELSLDLLVVAGFDGYIRRVNPSWERLLGWTDAELTARPYLEFIHPEDRESTAQEAAGLAVPGAETRDFEMRLRARDGSYRWLLWTAQGHPEEQALHAVGKDITERKASDEALREAEERFRSVTQSVNDAIVSADGESRIVFWNEAARELFGYQAEEVHGQPLTILMPERYREAHRRGIARLQATGQPRVIGSTVELHGLRSDGSEFPLELSLGSWQLDERTFYTGVIRDISERKRSQSYMAAQLAVSGVLAANPPIDQALPALLAGIGQSLGWLAGGFWLPDQEAGVLRCAAWWGPDDERTQDFQELTRRIPLELGVGLPGRVWQSEEPAWILDVTREANFPRREAALRAGLHGAVGVPIVSAGKVVAVMDFFSAALRQPDDDLTQMMSTISTQIGQFMRRKQAEAELAETSAELASRAAALERSNAELEQFAYIASHDLSEPLRQVSGFVQLLSQRYQGQLDDDADEFIGFTTDGVARMQRLIDDLLAYSRVGHSGREDGPVDAGWALERARRALTTTIEERDAVVEVDPLPTVWGDELELCQLFQNLLSNAIKFSRVRPHVRITAQREGSWWQVCVDDNGIGIEPRHAERIFKMFQRLHGRGESPGTGIGLAICKKTVERQGGEIEVSASDLGGSSFRFTLPAADPEAREEQPA